MRGFMSDVTYVRTLAGIIWDSGAASMTDCHVLVEPGITNPKSNLHSTQYHCSVHHLELMYGYVVVPHPSCIFMVRNT